MSIKQVPSDVVDKKIEQINIHWQKKAVDREWIGFKKRGYFDLFFSMLSHPHISRAIVLMGPRRVGKTVMLFQSIQEFLKKGWTPGHIVYLPMDEPHFYSLSLEDLVHRYMKIQKLSSLKEKVILFDEIQYLKGWDAQLKILTDRHKRAKFVVSGSAAGALKRGSIESGAGRFTDFTLPPLTFFEYLNLLNLEHKLLNIDPNTQQAISAKSIKKLNQEFIHYINYGGFPEAIVNKMIRQNPERFIRRDILEKVLLRDLPSLYGIDDIQELNRLFVHLAYQTGNEISYDSLSKTSGVTKNTIKKYMTYLEAAFLIRTINRINDKGKRFKRANYIKVYVTNPSIYTSIYGLVKSDNSEAMGPLVETALFSQSMHDHKFLKDLYYARFPNHRGEVDMVYLDQNFRVKSCLEVKWTDRYFRNPDLLQSLFVFCKHNNPLNVMVTTKTKNGQKNKNGFSIEFKESAIVCYNLGREQIKPILTT